MAVTKFIKLRQRIANAMQKHMAGQLPAKEVPIAPMDCGTCSACCRVFAFVPLLQHETGEGLNYELVNGKRVLKKNIDGSCIHLINDKCSVYEHRPLSCSGYDCRELSVCDVVPPEPEIAEAILKWKWDTTSIKDQKSLKEVRRSAKEFQKLGNSPEVAADLAIYTFGWPEKRINRDKVS